MKILVITDTPIAIGIHAPMNNGGISKVSTMSTDVDIVFAEDVIKGSVRGQRYNLILVPVTLREVEEVHNPVYAQAKFLTDAVKGVVQYYGIDYHPTLGKLGPIPE